MEYILLVIIIMLILVNAFKDYTHAKHLERLELRLKGLEPTELDQNTQQEQGNSISDEKYVDLSSADPNELAQSLARAANRNL